MVKGVGIDILDIMRMEKHIGDMSFMQRVFTDAEIAYIGTRAARAAGIFAAKEACLKALGVGLRKPLRDVEVLHEAGGRPYIRLEGGGSLNIQLSISHTNAMACAVVVIETEESQ